MKRGRPQKSPPNLKRLAPSLQTDPETIAIKDEDVELPSLVNLALINNFLLKKVERREELPPEVLREENGALVSTEKAAEPGSSPSPSAGKDLKVNSTPLSFQPISQPKKEIQTFSRGEFFGDGLPPHIEFCNELIDLMSDRSLKVERIFQIEKELFCEVKADGKKAFVLPEPFVRKVMSTELLKFLLGQIN